MDVLSGKRNDREGSTPGLLTRLRRDNRGNTLAIVGAALIPLTAMIGSGVDMSRAYMAKTRLQSACDAASLAGRRVMTNDTLDANVTAEAIKFFNFNFPQGLYQTAAFTPTVTRPKQGTVEVVATTTIPTTIMSMFGFKTLPLAVDCEASQNFVNTDVVLVLDTTGSMDDSLAGTKKIISLRDAVMALYDELKPVQDELEAGGMRLRYGIVPYSSTVNVGGIVRDQSSSYIADSWTYQSRTPIYSTSSTQRVGSSMTNSQCNAYAQSRTPANSYPSVAKTVARPGSGTNRPCDVTTTTYTRDVTSDFAYWIYEPRVLDTSSFKTGASVPLPTRAPGSSTTSTWSGCIEERETSSSINSGSGYNIPGGAHDLNINEIPSSDDTKWRPHWPDVIYERDGSSMFAKPEDSGYWACPTPAKRLKAWTRSDLQNYVNSLKPVGGTYHDIGMIWGAHLISGGGIFGADNPDSYHGMPVARHVIFMTDGQLAPNSDSYSAYGIEYLDERVTGGYSSSSDQYNRHEQRFKMACNATKGLNVSIWVIAFGTTATPTLTECASSASQVATITNRDALIDKFTEIGKNIGALRLTQ